MNALGQDMLNQDMLDIKGVKVPNFFKQDFKLQYEFCTQIVELYEDYILQPKGCLNYELENSRIMKSDVVFDCGANMGLFAAYAATQGAQVYCFEPCDYTRTLLEQTRKLYPDNIKIYPYALGAEEKNSIFLQTGNIAASHLFSYDVNLEHPVERVLTVPVLPLDKVIVDLQVQPSFFKIDVEGAELDVLKGMKNYLKKYLPYCAVGIYHSKGMFEKIHTFLRQEEIKYSIFDRKGYIFLLKEKI